MRKIVSRAILTVVCASGQTPELSPQFEVASIKIAPPPKEDAMFVGPHGGPGTDDPGLFTCENCDIARFLSIGFDLRGDHEVSAPDWIRETKFNVSARIPTGITQEQFRLMMQNFLMQRFKLTFHYQKKEMPAFVLVVAKNGPKMKESSVPLPPPDADAKPLTADSLKKDADGFPILPPGREPSGMSTRTGAAFRFADESMAQFAGHLAAQLRKPVTDETGLAKRYDFTIHWVPEQRVSSIDSGPNIFEALQGQLGLKLEPKKTTVDVLVIDHIEKTPTEN